MDADLKSRRQVSYDQMSSLLEFLQEHQDLAKGLTRGRRGKLHSLKLWNLCAKKLNPIKDGATKEGKGWSKYWCDWKYRVRRKALELKAAKDSGRSPPEGIVPLSHMEDVILGLIGEHAVDGIVIKSDPLADGDHTDDEKLESNENNEEAPAGFQYNGTRSQSTKSRKRRNSSRDRSDDEERGGPSSPAERKPRVTAPLDEIAIDSDEDEDASAFLRLEKQKLENSQRTLESVQAIASQMTRLADVMTHIRDILINNRINI